MSINRHILTLLLLVAGLSTCLPVAADYYQAQQHYQAGEYPQSFQQFQYLAQLGDISAQMSLAQSYALGHGSDINLPYALAWSLLAKDNGHPTADRFYSLYRSEVKSRRAVKQIYRELKQKYGRQALQQTIYPQINSIELPIVEPANPITVEEPPYPITAYERKTQQFVLLMYDIDGNGHTTNIQVLFNYPDQSLNKIAIKTIESWRFAPSFDQYNNPISRPNQLQLLQLFGKQNQFAQSTQAEQIKRMANQGIAEQQYLYALLLEAGLVTTTTANNQAVINWLTRAAVNHYGPAAYHLSLCLSYQGRCQQNEEKANLWLQRAIKNHQTPTPQILRQLNQLLKTKQQDKALKQLESQLDSDQLSVLTLYANLLIQKPNPTQKQLEQAVKIARQAMALDHDNPRLLAILAQAHYQLDSNNQQWQQLLSTAIAEAEYRQWPIDYYVELLDQYQLATLLQSQKQKSSQKKPAKNP